MRKAAAVFQPSDDSHQRRAEITQLIRALILFTRDHLRIREEQLCVFTICTEKKKKNQWQLRSRARDERKGGEAAAAAAPVRQGRISTFTAAANTHHHHHLPQKLRLKRAAAGLLYSAD